jgi:hypothetical protein
MAFKDVEKLVDLNSGAIEEQFSRDWKKVLANIGDPSTDANAVRKITISVAVYPNTNRSSAKVLVSTKASLAPVKSDENLVMLELTNNGVVAMTNEPEKQLELDNVLEMPKAVK